MLLFKNPSILRLNSQSDKREGSTTMNTKKLLINVKKILHYEKIVVYSLFSSLLTFGCKKQSNIIHKYIRKNYEKLNNAEIEFQKKSKILFRCNGKG